MNTQCVTVLYGFKQHVLSIILIYVIEIYLLQTYYYSKTFDHFRCVVFFLSQIVIFILFLIAKYFKKSPRESRHHN